LGNDLYFTRSGIDNFQTDENSGSLRNSFFPDITIQFPNFRFAIAIDIKPVPQEIFDKGCLPSVVHLYESNVDSIKGRRNGTIKIFNSMGMATLYLYLPYPSLFQ
jgi:hypothetical protein